MSTPQGNLAPQAETQSSSPNLYNQMSSMGMEARANPEEMQEQPKMESLVEKATKEFGAVFNSFNQLTESYPGAEKEKKEVQNAMANWHLKIASQINESGGNSTY